jgi:methylglutaconyl-CoA hydratase
MSDLVTITNEGSIVTLTMNRPEARNALSYELIEAMNGAMDRIEGDAASGALRVMVLAGAGQSFCAGMDLRGVIDDPPRMGRMLREFSRFMRRVRRLPVPTIAVVQGAAVGGGCGLMVVTDFAFTHPESKVGYPEVDLGVCPAVVAPWLMRKLGAGRARSMLLAGGTMSGREGFETGLATHLAAREQIDAAAGELAAKLLKGGPHAVAVTKRWLNELDGSMDDGPLVKAADLSAQVIAGEEAQSRLRAIFATRK